MPSEERNAPGKGSPIQSKKGANLSGVRVQEEFFGHSAPLVCTPIRRPGVKDTSRDSGAGRDQWTKGEIGGFQCILGSALLGKKVGAFVASNPGVGRDPYKMDGVT